MEFLGEIQVRILAMKKPCWEPSGKPDKKKNTGRARNILNPDKKELVLTDLSDLEVLVLH